LRVVAVAALLFPAIFHFSYQVSDRQIVEHEHGISVGTSVILLLVYGAGLLFTLRTHSHIFTVEKHAKHEDPAAVVTAEAQPHEAGWSAKRSIIVLLLASVGIGLVAELLVGSAETMAHSLGWNKIFVGVILLAIIGNAAEHSTALLLAKNDDMDTAMTITYQSSLQIALFATPFLVLLSMVFTRLHVGQSTHMDLIFSPMEVVALAATVGIVVVLGLNGQTNWFEGVLLLAVYAILGIVFFFIPESGHAEQTIPGAPAVVVTPPHP
jgi:Ca2+:H+ antiporter